MPSSIATEGENLQLKCEADANPTPQYYRWTKDGSDIGENSETYMVPVVRYTYMSSCFIIHVLELINWHKY